jgi:hypothetical protein
VFAPRISGSEPIGSATSNDRPDLNAEEMTRHHTDDREWDLLDDERRPDYIRGSAEFRTWLTSPDSFRHWLIRSD